MDAAEIFAELTAKTGVRGVRGFWDLTRHGKKPQTYFVWRRDTADSVLNSDDAEEAYRVQYAVSVFAAPHLLDAVCSQLQTAAEALDLEVNRWGFEDYEKDTGFAHGELTVTQFLEN